jgi:hypothetical protein
MHYQRGILVRLQAAVSQRIYHEIEAGSAFKFQSNYRNDLMLYYIDLICKNVLSFQCPAAAIVFSFESVVIQTVGDGLF